MSGATASAPPAAAAPQPQQSLSQSIAKVVGELERLRFDFLHASIGLPLPSVRQLVALARLRPSCLPHDPQPPPLLSTTPTQQGGPSMTMATATATGPIAPRVGPLPAWTIHQTRAFGQVCLERMKKTARAQGLSLDAYTLTAARAEAMGPAPAPASALEAWHHEAVRAFNSGRGVSEIARTCQQQQRPPQQHPAAAVIEEATVLRWLAEADGLGLAVAWEQRLGVSPALMEAVGVAVEVARALEEGGRDPLALDFPLVCLRQLLPDYGDADVLAALCALRHRRRQQAKQQQPPPPQRHGQQKQQQQQSGTATKLPNRAPLACLPCPPPRQQPAPPPAPAASSMPSNIMSKPQTQPSVVQAAAAPPAPAPEAPANTGPSLEAQVMGVLQARGGAAEGVTVDECVRALSGKVSRAAVEGVLGGLEESFLAYRGPGGGFKLL